MGGKARKSLKNRSYREINSCRILGKRKDFAVRFSFIPSVRKYLRYPLVVGIILKALIQ